MANLIFLDVINIDMTAQEITKKLKKELPQLVQPSSIDKSLVEVYDDVIHLCKCIDPFDTSMETYNILRKYLPELPEKHPIDE